jgi:hypothetical protein
VALQTREILVLNAICANFPSADAISWATTLWKESLLLFEVILIYAELLFRPCNQSTRIGAQWRHCDQQHIRTGRMLEPSYYQFKRCPRPPGHFLWSHSHQIMSSWIQKFGQLNLSLQPQKQWWRETKIGCIHVPWYVSSPQLKWVDGGIKTVFFVK